METKLRDIRTRKGLSQEELAEKSGVARSIISALENGKASCVTTKTMQAIASALECKVSEIFLL